MQKKKIVSYLVAGLGVVMALIGVDGLRRRWAPSPPVSEAENFMAAQRSRWTQGNDESPEYYSALLQLAWAKDPAVLKEIWKIIDENKKGLTTAAEALGFYPDTTRSLQFWEDCLGLKEKDQGKGSSSPLLRACLKGLGKHPSATRAQHLLDWRQKHRDFSDNYWLATESLWETTEDGAQKLDLQNELELWIRKNANSDKVFTPYLTLIRKGEYTKSLRDLSVDLFERTTLERLHSVILTYLVQKDDRDFLGRWSHYLKKGNDRLKKTALRWSHFFCFPERGAVLGEFLSQKENKKYLNDALTGMAQLGEVGTALVLDQVRQKEFWSPQELQQIDEVSALLRQKGLRQSRDCRESASDL